MILHMLLSIENMPTKLERVLLCAKNLPVAQTPTQNASDFHPTFRYNATKDQTTRSIIIFLISAIALAGFSPLGQVLVQFIIVWQR